MRRRPPSPTILEVVAIGRMTEVPARGAMVWKIMTSTYREVSKSKSKSKSKKKSRRSTKEKNKSKTLEVVAIW